MVWQSTEYQFEYEVKTSPKYCVPLSKWNISACHCFIHKWKSQTFSYSNHAEKKKTTIEEVKAKRVLSVIEWRSIYIPFACTSLQILTEGKKKQCPENITKTIDIAHISTPVTLSPVLITDSRCIHCTT